MATRYRHSELPVFVILLLHLAIQKAAFAQIQIEDRELQGQVGFTNSVLALPDMATGSITAQSVGLSSPFNNTGVVYGGTPLQRDHAVVVHAFDLGEYWLTTVLGLGPQRYRFGYAANAFTGPGYPNFVNGVFNPVVTPATPASPDPITGVDLLECAAGARVHFLEPDGQGGFVAAGHFVTGTIAANPRTDPATAAPPYGYRSGSIDDPAGGAQATRLFSSGTPELFARASTQSGGPDVLYQLAVSWRFSCPEVPTECPGVVPLSSGVAHFEGAAGTFGSFGPGGAASAPGGNPGVLFACDNMQDFYVVVPPSCDPVPPCPPPPQGDVEGCVNLIGEIEIFAPLRTSVGGATSVSNSGQSPVPFSDLFDNFDLQSSEGIYGFVTAAGTGSIAMVSQHALDGGLGWFTSPFASGPRPAEGETVTGPDFCMVPGVYSGTVTLRDATPGGVATGASADLQLSSSALYAFGPDVGAATRYFGAGLYDPALGVYTIPYDNVFSNPGRAVGAWSQPRMEHYFQNASQDPAFFVTGASRIEFAQPAGGLTFDPGAFIDTASGGLWAGALEPGTRIAPRAARTFPVDYDICYGTLRVQVNSRTALFFDPRISIYTGSEVDDAGTPGNPADDTIYGVFPRQEWSGSPRTSDEAGNTGFVNMRLPRGLYTGVAGTIRTVLAPGQFGTTSLPPLNLDVDLDCGDVCTAVPDAILCLTPIDRCNDPAVAGAGSVDISGTLNHTRPISSGYYRVNDGAPVPVDLASAGVTCSPAPCSDTFTVTVTGFEPCRNRIEIGFVDDDANPIAAFLATTLDTASPAYLVPASIDPEQPEYVCGTPVPFSPPYSCDNVPLSLVPLPTPADNCAAAGDPDSPLIMTSDAPATFPPGTTTVHLSAVDACGNGATCEVPVVIADTTPPQVECGAANGYTLIANDSCLGPSTIIATIADNCDPSGAITVGAEIELPGGGLVTSTGSFVTYDFPLGDSVVRFTATDTHGNTTLCSAGVHVVDQWPPKLICPYTETIGLNSPTPELDGLLLYADFSHAPLNTHLTWTGGTTPYRLIRVPAPAQFGTDPQFATLGTILLASAAVNSHDDGNYSDGGNYFYRVFQQDDGMETFECDSPGAAIATCTATVTDNCGIAAVSNSVTGATLNASGSYPLGDTLVDFSATDTSSNNSACASTVRVVDTTPPDVQCPADITLTITDPAGIAASDAAVQAWLATASATDICGAATVANDAPGIIPATCAAASAMTTVTFTATDEQGLTSTCTATFTVILDQDGDGFVCNADCDDTSAAVHPGAAEVCNNIDDDCDGTVDGLPTTCGVGACAAAGQCTGGVDSCAPGSPVTETCNGTDDDCDGTVDEGCGSGKVTGGGEIAVPGGVASYGFVVQRKMPGDPVTGQLEYQNHARGLNVHSVTMLTLTVSPTIATFSGTCTKNNSVPCTFSVTVQDLGEPGTGVDHFTITISDEPVEGDTGAIIHGNIQIHAN